MVEGLKAPQTVFVETDDLTYEMLSSREGVQYIEVFEGVCTSEDLDGRITSTQEEYYNYTSYRHTTVKPCVGDKVLTYLVYNAYTQYEDDIIARWDYVTECVNGCDHNDCLIAY